MAETACDGESSVHVRLYVVDAAVWLHRVKLQSAWREIFQYRGHAGMGA